MRHVSRLLLVLALACVLFFAYLNVVSGEFKTIEPVEQGECAVIDGVPGAEDIDQHRADGYALISSTDRAGSGTGGIYRWRLDGSSPPELLTGDDPGLAPHGISLVETGAGSGRLYAIDHRRAGPSDGTAEELQHFVRVYDWDGEGLEYVTLHSDDLLVSPNDVAGLADGTFYVTNDHGSRPGLARMAEDYLRIGGGNVVYHDGSAFRVVAEDILYANGITVDEEDGLVYVASTTTGRIHVFDRDEATGDLSPLEVIETGTGVDNLSLDRFGNVWVAAHPKLLTFVRHARDPQRRSPSEALWIAEESFTTPRIRPLWRNEGEQLSGSSVIVPVGGRFLVGSVFEPHALVCERTF